jgi:hypothetical protein
MRAIALQRAIQRTHIHSSRTEKHPVSVILVNAVGPDSSWINVCETGIRARQPDYALAIALRIRVIDSGTPSRVPFRM